MPFGETWVEVKTSTDVDLPYRFTGKELDAKLKGHGGVFNPINLDAYHYAGQNPVKFVDPDGNDFIILNPVYQLKQEIEQKLDNINFKNTKDIENNPQINRGLNNALGFIDGFIGISIFHNAVNNPQNEYIFKITHLLHKS